MQTEAGRQADGQTDSEEGVGQIGQREGGEEQQGDQETARPGSLGQRQAVFGCGVCLSLSWSPLQELLSEGRVSPWHMAAKSLGLS